MKLTRRLERWAFCAYRASARDLAGFRILLAAYLMVRSFPQGQYIGSLPAAFFDPPLSVAALSSGFLGDSGLIALHLIAAASLLLLLLGYRTPWASVASTLSLIVLQSFVAAAGKIDHTILVAVCPAIMATSGWGALWSLDAYEKPLSRDVDRARGRWQLAWLALTITLAMATAGFAKLYSGWLSPRTAASYGHAVANAWLSDRHTWLGGLLLRPGLARAWELLDWQTVAFELLAPLTIVRARWLRAWCIAACSFHLGVGLTMDIWFAPNVLAYAAFFPWGSVLPPASRTTPRTLAPLAVFAVLLLLAEALSWRHEEAWLRVRESVSRGVVLGALPLTVYLLARRRRAAAGAAAVRVS